MDLSDPWATPASAPAPARPAGRRWTADVVAVGVLATLVLVAATATALGGSVEQAERLRAAERELDGRLPALMAFVEQERGLRFTGPVEVELLSDDDFERALLSGEELDTPDVPADLSATLYALGLLDPDEDLEAQSVDSVSDIVGFYDSAADRLAVRGSETGAYVDLVVVHELTHALQDQAFDLDRPELGSYGGEEGVAFTALVEGDATRVENAWRAAQSAEVRRELDEAEAAFPETDISLLDLLLAFPYFAGEPYVEQVLAQGGQLALDAAFRTPPVSTEQVLHPGAGAPVIPPAPEATGTRVDQGVLGEQGLALLLGVDPTRDGPQVGWGGDRYVTVEDGDRSCTSATIVMDTPRDRDELLAALPEAGYDDVRATGDRDLALRSCSG